MHYWPAWRHWQRSISKGSAVGGKGSSVVKLKTFLSQVGSELTEVSACPGVDTGVQHKVRAALGHQLHPPTPSLLGDQAHHVRRWTKLCRRSGGSAYLISVLSHK